MFASILLPKRLVEALEARGLDVVDIIVNALRDELDPRIVAEARVELAERLLDEARKREVVFMALRGGCKKHR